MADTRIRMPAGSGGIVRYFDEYKSKVQISPIAVIILIIAVVIVEFFLHKLYG